MEQDKEKRVREIVRILEKEYPKAGTALLFTNPLELLVATVLSAQCTDERVNKVTRDLFKKYKTAEDYARADLQELENDIRPTGFFRNKAKAIKGLCTGLVENFQGQVPANLDDLVSLKGIGRKTANLVLGEAFGIPGIVVDTHVARISKRLGFTGSDNPVKIEFDLMEIIPKKNWNDFSLQLIYFGRAICKARNPLCPTCPLYELCEFAGKITRT